MDFVYVPPFQLGDIRCGMPQEEVRRRLGGPFKEFQKSVYAKGMTDDFPLLGIHVYYDENRLVKGVELFREAQLIVRGVLVIGRPLSDTVNELTAAGLAGVRADYGWKSLDGALRLGVGDETDDDRDIVESAYVGLRPAPL